MQYLDLVKKIVDHGYQVADRTGVGTLSLFGNQMCFSLENGTLPLLTTKSLPWKVVVAELLWFISGDTNSKNLEKKGVNIWNANGTRQFLDKNGFHDRVEGDLGPIYGFQWRHCGAEYKTCFDNYSGQGIDQLARVIEKLKNNPHDRRIIMSAWNVTDISKMALPPCHCLVQFYVGKNNELSCQLYQRSADVGLGMPFNIASYALLTHMIAHITKLKPGKLIHVTGDTHIYKNHIDQLKLQIQREPKEFPKLEIKRAIDSIDNFKIDDFELKGYDPHLPIKMEMAI